MSLLVFLFWVVAGVTPAIAQEGVKTPDESTKSEVNAVMAETSVEADSKTPAVANDEESVKSEPVQEAIQIEFYGTRTLKFENEATTIEIVGQVNRPGSFEISSQQPPKLVVGSEITDIDVKSISEELKYETEEDGRFEFILKLPVGQVQLPMVFQVSDSSQKQPLVLALVIEEQEIKLANKIAEFKEQNNFAWVGVGFNLLSFNQNFGAPIVSELKFESFKGPEFSLGYYRKLKQNFKLGLEYRNSPGAISANSSVSVSKGEYAWQAFVLDGVGSFNRNYPMHLLFGWRGRMQYRLGLQYHQIPFIRRSSTTGVGILSDSLGLLSMGLGFEGISVSRKWKTDIFMRMQHLAVNGSEFKISSFLAFEGLLGFNRMLTENWLIGVQWNGQYIAFSYDGLSDPPTGGTSVTGKLSMLHSLLELRLGYSW